MSGHQSPPSPESARRAGQSRKIPNSPFDATTQRYFDHADAPRVNTDVVLTRALREQYPQLELVVTPGVSYANLLRFAAAGHASITPVTADSRLPSSLQWTVYIPPARRAEDDDGSVKGFIGESIIFGKYVYEWNDSEFILYIADGRDGVEAWPEVVNFYILGPEKHKIDALILAAGSWGSELHDEILVFDQGEWMRSAELWQSVNKATWDAVILDENMKKALIDDHLSFFASKQTYLDLQVPWKRGIIYHGPPGNGELPCRLWAAD
jgi:transitional endoplasmic reticulum ATPase